MNFRLVTGTGTARRMRSALITTDAKVEIHPGGLLTVNSGSRIFSAAEESQVVITGGAINLVGSIHAGATVNAMERVVWPGRSADVVITAGKMVLGGKG